MSPEDVSRQSANNIFMPSGPPGLPFNAMVDEDDRRPIDVIARPRSPYIFIYNDLIRQIRLTTVRSSAMTFRSTASQATISPIVQGDPPLPARRCCFRSSTIGSSRSTIPMSEEVKRPPAMPAGLFNLTRSLSEYQPTDSKIINQTRSKTATLAGAPTPTSIDQQKDTTMPDVASHQPLSHVNTDWTVER